MKYISTFENFINDENRGNNAELPQFNQATNLKAKEYVEQIFNQGAGSEVFAICKEIGCETPKDDSSLDSIKDAAIKYFTENPERMQKNSEATFKTFPYNSGDGVVRTNNVGGVMHESKKPQQNGEGCTKIELSEDQMKLFGQENQLIRLIRSNKITLHDKEVWYNDDDESTKRILDIFID